MLFFYEINRKNKFGQTVLHIASKCGDIKCLKYILQQGGDINTTVSSILQRAYVYRKSGNKIILL